MVVFDTSILLLALDPDSRPPKDPETGEPVDRASKRVDYLIDMLSADREQIIVPTPVLSELLVHAGAATGDYLEFLQKGSAFRIAPFDAKAAIENALLTQQALQKDGLKTDAGSNDSRSKVKFDRQIVAIARVEGARAVYSDDRSLLRHALRSGLTAYGVGDLPLPPEDPQTSMAL